MSTSGIVIQYIEWGYQFPNLQEIHCCKWEFCVLFVPRFSGTFSWRKTRPTCAGCKQSTQSTGWIQNHTTDNVLPLFRGKKTV